MMTISNIEDVLKKCGVTEATLSAAEKCALDEQGYVVLAGLTDNGWLAQMREAFEESADQPATNGKQSGTRRTSGAIWNQEAFDGVYTHPGLLAAVHHVLRRSFKLNQASGRDPLPGYGQQGLHADWMQRAPQEPFYVATALWLLDDFTETNGATRVVPGSHLWLKALPKPMQQPESRHPDEKIVIARAGSALVFNGHLQHSGTRNQSNLSGPRLSRRVLQMVFWAREMARPIESPSDIPARLMPAARYILGV